MSALHPESAGPAGPLLSPRVAVARVAEQVLGHLPGVALTAGPAQRWVTPDGARPIPGVVATAQADGRYELELHLIVAWPPEPFERLGDEVRRRIRAAAKRSGLETQLGEIEIHIDGVQGPDELPPAGQAA